MKKITLICITFLYSITFLAQTTAIPDANFEQALIDLGIDSNGLNGNILNSDAESIVSLLVQNKNISDLTGIEAFTNITTLYCNQNNLTDLDLTYNPNIQFLIAWGNNLTNLNISTLSNLYQISCDENNLSSIDFSNNTLVTRIECSENPLTTIDVSQLTELRALTCFGVSISSLDVSNNLNLEELYCGNNTINELDLSMLPNFERLNCSNCSLTSLNIKNGNNTNVTYFRTTSNPNLTCVEVDDVAYSNTNWIFVDAQTSFSTDCSNLSVEDESIELFSIYPNPANTTLFIKNNTNISIIKASLFNTIGQKVWSANGDVNAINVENFPKGIYMLTVQTNDKISSKQILIN